MTVRVATVRKVTVKKKILTVVTAREVTVKKVIMTEVIMPVVASDHKSYRETTGSTTGTSWEGTGG